MSLTCTCKDCVAACRRIPGLMMPTEALRAVREGYASDLMVRWQYRDRERGRPRHEWQVMMPRSYTPAFVRLFRSPPDHERRDPMDSIGQCVFLTVDGLCEIHDSGFKPIECRAAFACDKGGDAGPEHDNALRAWDTFVGRTVINIWKRAMRRQAA